MLLGKALYLFQNLVTKNKSGLNSFETNEIMLAPFFLFFLISKSPELLHNLQENKMVAT